VIGEERPGGGTEKRWRGWGTAPISKTKEGAKLARLVEAGKAVEGPQHLQLPKRRSQKRKKRKARVVPRKRGAEAKAGRGSHGNLGEPFSVTAVKKTQTIPVQNRESEPKGAGGERGGNPQKMPVRKT